ncbi:MAG: hypothetical protein WD025_05880 [Bacteriovoracaceae bacterium]
MNKEFLGEKGNFTVMSALFLFMFGSWACLYLQKELLDFARLKARLRAFYCMKNLNGSVKSGVQTIEKLNHVIDASNAAIAASGIAPQLLAAAKAAKKTAQALQDGRHLSHMKNLVELGRKKCLFNLDAYKTPYKHKILLSRDAFGKAKLRKKKWSQTSLSKEIVLNTRAQSIRSEVKLESESWEVREVLPWRK